jgi:MSHA pilin protein MshD
MNDSAPRYAGFTLIELVIAIAILAIGASALVVLINSATRHSLDPLVRQQANAIAQSYLEEALLSPFCDPDISTNCPAACTVSPCGSASCTSLEMSGGVPDRPNFDDICDYNSINDTSGPVDRDGNPLSPSILGSYNVRVNVVDTGVTLNGLNSNNGQVVRVDVIVTNDNLRDLNVMLSAYKANY